MGRTTFILGAGFGADAGPAAGPIKRQSLYGPYEFDCSYPLASNLAALCFPGRTFTSADSVEEWFQGSIDRGDVESLRALFQELMKADNYLVPELIGPEETPTNCYSRFFHAFPNADFITFNYDAFVEASLYRLKRWSPHDGYGVPVGVEAVPSIQAEPPGASPSSNLVLHLHGSLCVYASKFDFSVPGHGGVRWLKPKPEINFLFDPGSIGHLFAPWRKVMDPFLGFAKPEERVIAPVPDKAIGLKGEFVMNMRSRASETIASADQVVAIGYNFSPADRCSFEFLFHAFAASGISSIRVIAPSARAIADRLTAWYPNIACCVKPLTFREWSDMGFPSEAP